VPVDPQVWTAYAGSYRVRTPDGEVNGIVRIDGACISLQLPSQQEEFELFAMSEDRFYIWGGTIITFYRDSRGEVDRAAYLLSGMAYEATRIP